MRRTQSARRPVSRLPRERRLADIASAARAVFAERGYEQASMAEIAERAGIVEGTIYRFFDHKRDLLSKVVERWYEEMLADYDRQLAGVRGTWNRLRFMIWHHLKSIHENPDLSRLVFKHIRTAPDYRRSVVYELNRRYTRHTIDIVEEGIAAGELRPDLNLRLVRDLIYGCVEHHTFAYLAGTGDYQIEGSADEITDLVYCSLAAKRAESSRSVLARLEAVARRLEQAPGR